MALLDWKSLKDKVKQVSDNVVEFAKDASDNVAEFAKETSDNVAEVWNSEEAIKFREGVVEKIDKVKATSLDITQKTTEFWNSEEVMHIREDVHLLLIELRNQTLFKRLLISGIVRR